MAENSSRNRNQQKAAAAAESAGTAGTAAESAETKAAAVVNARETGRALHCPC